MTLTISRRLGQTTAASHALAQESDELAMLTGRFRVQAGTAPARSAAPAKRVPPRLVATASIRGNTALKLQPVEAGWEEF